MKKPYLALLFAAPDEIKKYGADVWKTINEISGGQCKRGESGAKLTAIAFFSDLTLQEIAKRLVDKHWMREEFLWVVPLEHGAVMHGTVWEWVRRNRPDIPDVQ